MSKFRNIKVRIESPEQCEAMQMVLFEHKCYWPFSKNVPQNLHAKFIFVDGSGCFGWGKEGEENHFNSKVALEMSAQSIIDPYYDVKIAWANGETVQYLDGGVWVDLNMKNAIDFIASNYWRVKPKTKTIKAMMQDWYNPLSKQVLSTEVGVGYTAQCLKLGEPYEKEFEVPNDW